jgi:transcriptional regulator with XRE-family HTH domain
MNETNHITLSKGERILVARRHAGLTQAEFAGLIGAPVHWLKQWEHDQRDDAPAVRVTAFYDRDWCFVQRRRQGWLLRDLAEKTGLAAKWLHRAERGEVKDIRPLVVWWTQWLDKWNELPTCLEACCNPSDTPRDPYPLGPDAGLEQKSTDATKALRTDDGLRELLA